MIRHNYDTDRFTDIDELKLLEFAYNFRLEPIFATAQAASKNDSCFKSGPKELKNDHLALLI